MTFVDQMCPKWQTRPPGTFRAVLLNPICAVCFTTNDISFKWSSLPNSRHRYQNHRHAQTHTRGCSEPGPLPLPLVARVLYVVREVVGRA